MIAPFKTLHSPCLAWEQMPIAKLLFSGPQGYLEYMQTDDSARVGKENNEDHLLNELFLLRHAFIVV